MHSRWMSLVLTAGVLGLGHIGALNHHVFAEENTTTVAQPPAPSMRGETGAVESRVGSSPPASLSSSWWGAVEQAERWKFAGDLALVQGQPVVAYPFYDKLARTFPGTPHGRVAARRGNYALYRLRHAGDYPPEEDDLRELYDLLTW